MLEVWSVDEQGVITEVIVDWGDGPISFAHAFCVQGDVRGQPHRMLLDHVYEEPGEYTVTVIAISKPRCFAPSGTSRESEEVSVDTLVTP